MKNNLSGFTLVELMVAITIIAILTAVLSANFSDARAQSRDKARMTSLKELQLAVELYKAQNGGYPATGCSAVNGQFAGPNGGDARRECDNYIVGLVPDFISELPQDPSSEESGQGFYYRSDGASYKILVNDSVELDEVNEGDEFARCPSAIGECLGGIPAKTYAVYSLGAESW